MMPFLRGSRLFNYRAAFRAQLSDTHPTHLIQVCNLRTMEDYKGEIFRLYIVDKGTQEDVSKVLHGYGVEVKCVNLSTGVGFPILLLTRPF